MKRVWKPLDVGGLRLYEVTRTFPRHPRWNCSDIVAAQSPREAAKLIRDLYADAQWQDGPPMITGHALNVYQPEAWWRDGVEGGTGPLIPIDTSDTQRRQGI